MMWKLVSHKPASQGREVEEEATVHLMTYSQKPHPLASATFCLQGVESLSATSRGELGFTFERRSIKEFVGLFLFLLMYLFT